MPRSRSMSEVGRPARSIQVWPGVPRWKRHSSTSTPCSTCTSSDVYSTRVKSSASSGTGARPASVPGAVPGLVWRWTMASMFSKAPLPASDLLHDLDVRSPGEIVAELAADLLEVRRRAMGLERRLVVISFQHDIDIGIGRLVQGIELVARLVGPDLGLQCLHGRFEIGIGAGLDGELGDHTEHVFAPPMAAAFSQGTCVRRRIPVRPSGYGL